MYGHNALVQFTIWFF